MMQIIPAIDLKDGEAVRLYQGDYNQKTVYHKDPVALANSFAALGASYLHIVDLDGAKDGDTTNLDVIRAIKQNVDIRIQVGGGIRTAETVALYLDDIGVDRVILGTVAVKNPDFVGEMIRRFGASRIVVGVDVRDGNVSVSGWLEDSALAYLPFIETLKSHGVTTIVMTDISKDGTLSGPNWDLYESVAGVHVIVSGGISSEEDIQKAAPYYGVIVGKAFYEGKVDLRACIQNASSPA